MQFCRCARGRRAVLRCFLINVVRADKLTRGRSGTCRGCHFQAWLVAGQLSHQPTSRCLPLVVSLLPPPPGGAKKRPPILPGAPGAQPLDKGWDPKTKRRERRVVTTEVYSVPISYLLIGCQVDFESAQSGSTVKTIKVFNAKSIGYCTFCFNIHFFLTAVIHTRPFLRSY